MTKLQQIGAAAQTAARKLALLGKEKSDALEAAAIALIREKESILQANAMDLLQAEANGLSAAKIDRLRLDDNRLTAMSKALKEIAAAKDPVGRMIEGGRRPNGLEISCVTVPLGVVGIIYESRPNVTSDAAALCIKAGNAVVLRGGKEAIRSNIAIAKAIEQAFVSCGLPENSIQLIEDTSRESAIEMMRLDAYLDALIPRGSAELIQSVKEQSRIPVIETGVGNCHIYVDSAADLTMAVRIIDNAKTSRPSVCNAVETVLIHTDVAEQILPELESALAHAQVELRADRHAGRYLRKFTPAVEQDWHEEYLDYTLAVKIVYSVEEAIEHISRFSSGHSESIITQKIETAERFLKEVNSAAVYVNASTRFTDGGEFGLGAEIGISTQKLHARGPMGLDQLTSHKYVIRGNGHIR